MYMYVIFNNVVMCIFPCTFLSSSEQQLAEEKKKVVSLTGVMRKPTKVVLLKVRVHVNDSFLNILF